MSKHSNVWLFSGSSSLEEMHAEVSSAAQSQGENGWEGELC